MKGRIRRTVTLFGVGAACAASLAVGALATIGDVSRELTGIKPVSPKK